MTGGSRSGAPSRSSRSRTWSRRSATTATCSASGRDGPGGSRPTSAASAGARSARCSRFQSEPDAKVGGQWHSFFVEGIDALYDFHGRNGAAICSPLEAKPWGLREYTVRDLNGHYLRFGQRGSDRSATAGREPATDVAIVERLPTPEELQGLVRAVGWAGDDRTDRAQRELSPGPDSASSPSTGEHAVGTGMVLGDGVTFAYLKDIVVLPEWQGRGIGTRIVEALLAVLRRPEPDGMLVTLFTGQHLADFYERFGFSRPREALRDEPEDRAASRTRGDGAAGEVR